MIQDTTFYSPWNIILFIAHNVILYLDPGGAASEQTEMEKRLLVTYDAKEIKEIIHKLLNKGAPKHHLMFLTDKVSKRLFPFNSISCMINSSSYVLRKGPACIKLSLPFNDK